MRRPTTLACLQTPPGRGGIAVIGLTGPDALAMANDLFVPIGSANPPRATESDFNRLHLGHLRADGQTLDEAILAVSPRGVELNLHGGPVVVRRVLGALADRGAILAEAPSGPIFCPAHPSFANPAIGEELQTILPQAVGLTAARLVCAQWSAGLSALARDALSYLEPNDARDAPLATTLAEQLDAAAERYSIVRAMLSPREVVLAGPPNAGKSTLMNALVGRPVSIVHDQAGTTRDWVRERGLCNGVPIWLTDTAGLWTEARDLDAQAVQRAWRRMEQADLIVLCHTEDDAHTLGRDVPCPVLSVRTKIEDPRPKQGRREPRAGGASDLCISAHTGVGMDALRSGILRALGLDAIPLAAPTAFTKRQHDLLRAGAAHLRENRPADARTTIRTLLGG
jgi:tRNA modification GTPase